MEILIVEDDPVIARSLQVNIESGGFRPTLASSLKQARQLNEQNKYNLILLDLNLPDGHGFDLLKEIRQSGSILPILILTAVSDEDSVVTGLQLGADDFIRKPFGNRELLARIQAVLRVPQMRERQLRYGDLLLLLEQRIVKYQEQNLDLSRREFDLLHHLVQRAEAIVTRDALINAISKDGEIFDRTIDSHISHLRATLKKSEVKTIKISSVYGVGYRLEKA